MYIVYQKNSVISLHLKYVIDMEWKMVTGIKASKKKFRMLLTMVSRFFMFKMKPHRFLNLAQSFTQLFLAPGL